MRHLRWYISPKTGNRLAIPKGKGYRQGCRCDECVKVQRNRKRAERERRLSKPVPHHVGHGTWNRYTNYGCRCAKCLEACRNAIYGYNAEYRELNRDQKNKHRREYYRQQQALQIKEDRERRTK